MGLWNVELTINKILLGAAIMIVLQLITIIMLYIHHKRPTMMNFVTAIIFISVALIAILNIILNIFPKEVYVVLGVMMFVEALYALH